MKKKKKSGREIARYSTDRVATNVFCNCARDLQNMYPHLREGLQADLLSGLKRFRAVVDDFDYSSTSVGRFKAHHQLVNLLKKYRFEHDVYSDDELRELSYKKFFLEQERISAIDLSGMKTRLVLSRARKIARSILGEYSESEMIQSCSFGTNSSIGCPLHLAHLDNKLSVKAFFTGSAAVSRWFKDKVLNTDPILARFIESQLGSLDPSEANLNVESLTLGDVPKTWKTLRIITPLPLLDLFYSNGLGSVITSRLNDFGLRISSLQQKHGKLVRRFSVTCSHVTADLSSASDSITSQLLNAILPRDWYCALKPILKHSLSLGDTQYYTASVLPMGNGATFPVETLIFYSIVQAIGDLADVKGIYSVYGDDLIYPSQLHKYVVSVFPLLGLVLNLGKTYVHANFRESCGSDYYRGTSVRPFFLQGEYSQLTRSKYEVYLYKIYNGLRARWEEYELPTTFAWLLAELNSITDKICRVPPSYPATAGIHVPSPDYIPCGMENLPWSPSIKRFQDGTRQFLFRYMSEKAPDRFVAHQEPYYWLSLQGLSDEKKNFNQPITKKWIERDLISSTPNLRWRKLKRYRSFYRGKRKIEVTYRVLCAYVSEKNLTSVRASASLVTDWT